MVDRTNATRNGVICVFLFAVCFLVSWPVAEMGFNDDWSYIKSAQVFAQTGHLVYNGWATAMLGWQIAWGALFVRIFGFSFTAVKISTLPIAMGALLLFHIIQNRFGISPRNAVIGTLTLGLSPMFMPLAASYMTDVPGLFVELLCLYLCQRAVAASTRKAAIAWLSCAAASSLVGGTARQIAWLGVLVMVPATGWFLRKRRGVLLSSSFLWAGGFMGVLWCSHWFAAQPYSIPERIPNLRSLHLLDPAEPLFLILSEILCLMLMVFPVLVGWLPAIRRAKMPDVLLITYTLLIWAVYQLLSKSALPWIGNIILLEFSSERDATAVWSFQHFSLPFAARFVGSLLVIAAALVFLAIAHLKFRHVDTPRFLARRDAAFWLLGPFMLSYLVLLLPRALLADILDRYALGLLPFAIIIFSRLYQDWVARDLPVICVFTVALYAVLGIAGTHDWFAWQRARLEAINEVRATGVRRTEIQGGLEYDGWTQIENGEHVNNPLIEFPKGSFNPNSEVPQVAEDCSMAFAIYTPVVHPRYSTVFQPKWCLQPTQFAPVQYHAWLPPFRRTIVVQGIPLSGPADTSDPRQPLAEK